MLLFFQFLIVNFSQSFYNLNSVTLILIFPATNLPIGAWKISQGLMFWPFTGQTIGPKSLDDCNLGFFSNSIGRPVK